MPARADETTSSQVTFRMTPAAARRRRRSRAPHAAWLWAGVACFLALSAVTARLVWQAWQQRSGEAAAEALLSLVEQRQLPRPTDAPGAMAWLRLELARYERHLTDARRAAMYRSLVAPADRTPGALSDLSHPLEAGLPLAPSAAVRAAAAIDAGNGSVRRERLVSIDGIALALTRRRALDAADLRVATPSNRFVRAAAPFLVAARAEIERRLADAPLPAVPDRQPPRIVRLYAVSEDGTLLSLPWDSGAAEQERARLGSRPDLPTFAPEEFFFRVERAAGSLRTRRAAARARRPAARPPRRETTAAAAGRT
jgi:hypothetical protein